jgi:hypothetical protein
MIRVRQAVAATQHNLEEGFRESSMMDDHRRKQSSLLFQEERSWVGAYADETNSFGSINDIIDHINPRPNMPETGRLWRIMCERGSFRSW